MSPEGSTSLRGGVIPRRKARLVFWLVVIALVGCIFSMSTAHFTTLASPGIIEAAATVPDA